MRSQKAREPPPGAGAQAAFGFRQAMVRHYVNDLVGVVAAAGVDPERVFAHQIPGELVQPARLRSGATPMWTGLTDLNGHLGVTRFGHWPAERASAMARRHGIFEWVPAANDDPELAEKVNKTLSDMRVHGGVAVFPGWWERDGQDPHYPLNDAPLAAAIGAWVRATGEEAARAGSP